MKQVLQYPNGRTVIEEVPLPKVQPGQLLVKTAASLISVGTERVAVEFAKKSLLQKARSRPDLARKVIEKARKDGVLDAWKAAKSRLDRPLALGYSAAGRIVDLGEGVVDLPIGQRVACAGAGYAAHAEFISVPRNLVAPVPDVVSMHQAAGATVATIALHGFRLAELALGETVCVIGLGLVGLCCAQIARAAGCRVIGVDLQDRRLKLASELGVQVVLDGKHGSQALGKAVFEATQGLGADAVLVAAATSSSSPMETATAVARDRARVIMVGAVGMELSRNPFFKKEITFSVSRSYGPGRYDPSYEEGGSDYPVGYVRWTENRNLEAVLAMMAEGTLQIEPLVSHAFPIGEAETAYELITRADSDSLGVLLTYPEEVERASRRVDLRPVLGRGKADPGIAFVGAGNFATGTLLPVLKLTGGARLTGVVAASGLSAKHAAAKFGFTFATTDIAEVLSDPGTDAVAIVTRHDRHAQEILAVLEAGRHVFCEKPLCLDLDELQTVVAAWRRASGLTITLGFNRRFALMASELKAFISHGTGPQSIQYRVNSGPIPADHWIRNPKVGGGRLIGETCHFIDLASYLTDAEPTRVTATRLPTSEEDLALTVGFSDGSVASISYVAQGAPSLRKERIEVHRSGLSGVLDNFQGLELHGASRRPKIKKSRQDKGHRGLMRSWVESLKSGKEVMPFRSVVATTLTTFAAVESIALGQPVEVDVDRIFTSGSTLGEGTSIK